MGKFRISMVLILSMSSLSLAHAQDNYISNDGVSQCNSRNQCVSRFVIADFFDRYTKLSGSQIESEIDRITDRLFQSWNAQANVLEDMDQKSVLFGVSRDNYEGRIGEMKMDSKGGSELAVSISFPKEHRKLNPADKRKLRNDFAKLAREALAKQQKEHSLRLEAKIMRDEVALGVSHFPIDGRKGMASEEMIYSGPSPQDSFAQWRKIQSDKADKKAIPAHDYVSPMGETLPVNGGDANKN